MSEGFGPVRLRGGETVTMCEAIDRVLSGDAEPRTCTHRPPAEAPESPLEQTAPITKRPIRYTSAANE